MTGKTMFDEKSFKTANEIELAVLNTREKGVRPAVKMHFKDDRYPALDPVRGDFIVDAGNSAALSLLKDTIKAMKWIGKSGWCSPEDKINGFQFDNVAELPYPEKTKAEFEKSLVDGAVLRACTATEKSTKAVTEMRKIFGIR